MVANIREQLYCGVRGDGQKLSPSYESDPYFNTEESGRFYLHPELYIEWKMQITPPEAGAVLGLPPRDRVTPNLWIDGTYHRSISAAPTAKGVRIFSFGFYAGGAIERKYGSQIYQLHDLAVARFNRLFVFPAIKQSYELSM